MADVRGVWRRGSESNRRIKVLQTSPLPLGYRALNVKPNLRSTADPSTTRLDRRSAQDFACGAPASLTPANRLNLGTAPRTNVSRWSSDSINPRSGEGD